VVAGVVVALVLKGHRALKVPRVVEQAILGLKAHRVRKALREPVVEEAVLKALRGHRARKVHPEDKVPKGWRGRP
jgi:hypothetical protein